eukprot:7313377-Pyramimonas_sp.AAC.1
MSLFTWEHPSRFQDDSFSDVLDKGERKPADPKIAMRDTDLLLWGDDPSENPGVLSGDELPGPLTDGSAPSMAHVTSAGAISPGSDPSGATQRAATSNNTSAASTSSHPQGLLLPSPPHASQAMHAPQDNRSGAQPGQMQMQ